MSTLQLSQLAAKAGTDTTYYHPSVTLDYTSQRIVIKGSVPDVTDCVEPFEKLWMPIKNKYVQQHQAPFFMHVMRSEGLTTLHFLPDGRVSNPEQLTRSVLQEMATAAAQLVSLHRQTPERFSSTSSTQPS